MVNTLYIHRYFVVEKEMKPKADNTFKVTVGGAGGVGKTTLLHKYLTGDYLASTEMTIGVQFHTHILDYNNKKIELVLWDLGGQDKFRFFQGNYIRGSRAALVCFDMHRMGTLSQVRDWVSIIKENAVKNAPIILVGMKVDLVSPELLEGIKEAANHIVEALELESFVVTSSKDGININETFTYLVEYIFWQIDNK